MPDLDQPYEDPYLYDDAKYQPAEALIVHPVPDNPPDAYEGAF